MKILVAEDEDFSRTLLEKTLEDWGYEVISVEDGREALRHLLDPDGPRLAVLDWNLPSIDGLEICRRVRSQPDQPLRYLLMLTARDRHEDVIQALDTGADAYMTKPWHLTHLRTRLNVGRRLILAHQKLEKTNRDLVRLSRTDPLTGLLSKSTLLTRLGEELERGQRRKEPLGVFLGHISGLGNIQSALGHARSNGLMQEIASKMKRSFRSYDLLGQLQPRQICVAIPGEDEQVVCEGMLRFKNLVGQVNKNLKESDLEVTCSVVGVFVPGEKPAPTTEVLQQLNNQLSFCRDIKMKRILLLPFGEEHQPAES